MATVKIVKPNVTEEERKKFIEELNELANEIARRIKRRVG